MIARTWTAQATREQAPRYAEHLRASVLPKLEAVDGYRSAMLLARDTGSGAELIVVTFWDSLGAIELFAGSDAERAVVDDEAAALLTTFDRTVRHYDVVFQSDLATALGTRPRHGS
jgi:heme-degrading monooxygenase HmoA